MIKFYSNFILFFIIETKYRVAVVTGDELGAGTDSNVFITVFGAKANTGEIKLNESNCVNQKKKDLFEKGTTDQFEFEAKDVGSMSHIKIGHDGVKMNAPWLLESVKVESKCGNET